MRDCCPVWLLCVLAVTLAGCSPRPNEVNIFVRSQNNALDDSQRIHINEERVTLDKVRPRVQSMTHGSSIPVNVRVGPKCDAALLGTLIQELLAIEPRPVLQIEQLQD